MKFKIVFTVCALLVASLGIASAKDVKFSMDRKKLGQSNTRSGGNMSTESKDIIYTIIVESTAFKDLENVTIEYNIYYEEAPPPQQGRPDPSVPKPQATPRTLAGKHTIEKLGSRKKTEFDTGSIVIKEVSSGGGRGGRGGGGGGGGQGKDRVVGSIIRGYNAEGKLIGEYINPTSVTSKFEWQKP